MPTTVRTSTTVQVRQTVTTRAPEPAGRRDHDRFDHGRRDRFDDRFDRRPYYPQPAPYYGPQPYPVPVPVPVPVPQPYPVPVPVYPPAYPSYGPVYPVYPQPVYPAYPQPYYPMGPGQAIGTIIGGIVDAVNGR